jgi:tetratricopeptide (TPR) repeat protein
MKRNKKAAQRRYGTIAGRSAVVAGPKQSISTWISVALIVLAVLPYLQVLRYDFVNFDDGAYVSENPLVQQGLTWDNIVWAFTTMSAGNWHPLTWISYMLVCQIFGVSPGAHHFVNALLHGVNTLLVFTVLRVLTGAVWRSALVAALFAVHPLHVESVAWISERKDVLSTCFGLAAIWAYAKYAKEPRLGRYAWVVFLFGLSLLSKPMLVTLPVLLLLLDIWPLRRFSATPASLFLEKLPLLGMSLASSIVTYKAQHAAGAVAPIDILPLSQRLANAIVAYVGYLMKTFWPVDLAAFYPRPDQLAIGSVALSLLILIGITIAVATFARSYPWLPIGWLWFLGTLVPVIGLVQVGDQSMADRYAYVPLIGIFIMIAWSLPAAAFASPPHRQLFGTMIALPLIALAALSFWQIRFWKDTRTLFNHALAVTTGNFVAHNLIAGALGEQGDLAGAREHVEKALELKSYFAGAHYNLGMILLRQRDYEKAQEHFKTALQTMDRDPMIWNALGVAQMSLDQNDEAISNFRHALEINPNFPVAFIDLGYAFLKQGKYEEAIEMGQKALRLKPDFAEAHQILGEALMNLRRLDESISHNRKALELKPDLSGALLDLGIALLAKSNYDEAIAQFEHVLQLNPENTFAQRLLTAAQEKRNEASTQP